MSNRNAGRQATPEATDSADDPPASPALPPVNALDALPAEEGRVSEFVSNRIASAIAQISAIIDEDYAQFRAEQTGFHPDYFRSA